MEKLERKKMILYVYRSRIRLKISSKFIKSFALNNRLRERRENKMLYYRAIIPI